MIQAYQTLWKRITATGTVKPMTHILDNEASINFKNKINKTETHRTRLTAVGNRINYPYDCGTPTADMTLFKILVNSIISTKGARCIMMDIKDFYLCTPMK